MAEKGFVYILKDGHFKHGVKIGRAHDVERRMRSMLTANPWLSVFIKVETSKWKEIERAVHNIIKLIAKTRQVGNSEFYLIKPEKARRIMLEFAPLFAKDDFTVYNEDGTRASIPRRKAIGARTVLPGAVEATGFTALGIQKGECLVFVPAGTKVVVADEKHVNYRGEKYTLTGFTKRFIPNPNSSGAYQGPKYFSYKGRNLLDIRKGVEAARAAAGSPGAEQWLGKTQLAKIIARRGRNEGAAGGIRNLFCRRRRCARNSKWRALLEAAGIKFDAQDYVIDWCNARNPL